MCLRCFALWLVLCTLSVIYGQERLAVPPPTEKSEAGAVVLNRPVDSTLEMQVELHRRGFSCGSIDGAGGAQTVAALRAFQRGAGIKDTGILDDPTREILRVTEPVLTEFTFSAVELARLRSVPDTWEGKSQMDALGYATALELAAERYHANPEMLRRLNPQITWTEILPGTKITVPAVERVVVVGTPAEIIIGLEARELEVIDPISRVIAHFPVSIARMAEKRPVGDLHVTIVIPNPDYTFDPDVFPESAEAKALGRKLIIPPGPNNPVGLAWIGLDRPGYGIHGTPEPENVGRTESHGCFRLANWDVLTLVGLVRIGMTVDVE